jgi:SAM-dependent methyltransferase
MGITCLHLLSIEYWPDPQRGIKEAYRVLKLEGKACLIGPVHPTFWLSRFFADVWMLFPKEEEYIEWFQKAGFKDVQLKRIGPKWYRGVRRHGLIMGCSVTGVKPASGDSPLQVTILDLPLHDNNYPLYSSFACHLNGGNTSLLFAPGWLNCHVIFWSLPLRFQFLNHY